MMKKKSFIALIVLLVIITTLFSSDVFRSTETVKISKTEEATSHASASEMGTSMTNHEIPSLNFDDKAPAAYHEFIMFGNDQIYLSHYAMFHAIHAYQVLFQASFKKGDIDVKKAFLEDRRQHPERSYTVSPSKKGSPISRRRDDWVLPDYMHNGVEFNADIHWGEEPEEFLFHDVTVRVDKIIFFRKFEESDQRDPQLTYLLFGDKGDRYIAHLISTIPDFDQIISVRLKNDLFDANQLFQFMLDKKNDETGYLKVDEKELNGMVQIMPTSGMTKNFRNEQKTPSTMDYQSEIYFENIEEQG